MNNIKLDIIESWVDFKNNKTKYCLNNGFTIVVTDNSADYIKDFSAELFNELGQIVGNAYMYEAISPISGDRIEEIYESSIPEEYSKVLRVINEDLFPCLLFTTKEAECPNDLLN